MQLRLQEWVEVSPTNRKLSFCQLCQRDRLEEKICIKTVNDFKKRGLTENDGSRENSQHVNRLSDRASESVVADHIPIHGSRVFVVSVVVNELTATRSFVGSIHEHATRVDRSISHRNSAEDSCWVPRGCRVDGVDAFDETTMLGHGGDGDERQHVKTCSHSWQDVQEELEALITSEVTWREIQRQCGQ